MMVSLLCRRVVRYRWLQRLLVMAQTTISQSIAVSLVSVFLVGILKLSSFRSGRPHHVAEVPLEVA